MTIQDELALLSNTKEAIRLAINQKGVTVTSEPFSQYPSKILSIQGVNNENIKITIPGTYLPSQGYTGFGEVEVDIQTVNNQNIIISQNGAYSCDTSQGYTGFGEVQVYVPPSPSVTDNVTYTQVTN